LGDSSRTRLLTSVEQRDGYVVLRVYEQVGDEYSLVATCAGQPEFVMRLLSLDADFSTLSDGI
jgi:hypothetical protein